MISESALERDERQREALHQLLDEKGLGRYATFFETGEGRLLPGGLEKTTGYVIDAEGNAHWFVLDWDAARRVIALTDFKPVSAKSSWNDIAEYRRARSAVGLDG
jgi:hypothetical protein